MCALYHANLVVYFKIEFMRLIRSSVTQLMTLKIIPFYFPPLFEELLCQLPLQKKKLYNLHNFCYRFLPMFSFCKQTHLLSRKFFFFLLCLS
jgi:hypothetical protein